MSDRSVTETVVRAAFEVDALDAIAHARCGPSAHCRRDALAKCDEDLDDYLALGAWDTRELDGTSVRP
jgi:hypothetical protein